MKLSKALNPKFQELLAKLLVSEVPMKTAFKLKKVSKSLDDALKDYDSTRMQSIKKFADLDEDGNPKSDANNNAIFLTDESRMEFAKELSELLDVEIDFNKISVDELGEKLMLSAVDLTILEDIIE
jgi:hypothetical protein